MHFIEVSWSFAMEVLPDADACAIAEQMLRWT